MKSRKLTAIRVECSYAALQSAHWASACTLLGFTTVYLSWCGLSNTQIGLTTSLFSVTAILLQLFVSYYSDAHPQVPIKKLILLLYLAAVTFCTLLMLIPLPLSYVIVFYTLGITAEKSIGGLLNALLMQFVDAGLPVRYGWPRGMASLAYAVTAYGLGLLVARFHAGILMPLFVGLTGLSAIFVWRMPQPQRPPAPSLEKPAQRPPTYGQMLRSHPTFVMFLIACIIIYIGESSNTVFLIRIIQSLDGGPKEYGVSILIQAGVELPALFASGWILNRWQPPRILTFSFFCYVVKAIGIAIAPSIGFLYGVMAFSLCCYGLFCFSSVIFVNGLIRPDEKVRAQSLVSLCASAGAIVGSTFSGYVMDQFGIKTLLNLSWIICILGAAMMVVCSNMHRRELSGAAGSSF